MRIRNYNIIRSDRPANRGGGVAILIRRGIPFLPLDPLPIIPENTAIRLADDTVVRAIYNPPGHRLTRDELGLIFTPNKVLAVGDFNSRHIVWNNHTSNPNGRLLNDYAETNGIAIVPPDSPSHFPRNGSRPSYIDLVLNKNYPLDILPHSYPLLSSDHNPVLAEIQDPNRPPPRPRIHLYARTNWRRFRELVNEGLAVNNDLATPVDIDEAVLQLTRAIQTARDRTTPLITPTPREYLIPQELKDLITFKNRIKRRWHRLRRRLDFLRLRDLQDTVNSRLAEHHNNTWEGTLRSLSPEDNSLWRLQRTLRRPYISAPALLKDGRPHFTDAEKAEVLVDHLVAVGNRNPELTPEQQRVADSAQSLPTRHPIPPRTLSRLITSPQEVFKLIKASPNRTAPGPDSLPYLVLKNLPRKAVVQITYIVNAILKLQYFPDSWKEANVVPILKAGKPGQDPNSYRPISLLNTLSKITEKIIITRLRATLDEREIIPPCQFGFRPGHSTTHALCRLVQDTTLAFNRSQSTTALFLDIEKAFDSVWHDGLVYKLHFSFHLPAHLVALIRSYLEGRKIRVKLSTTLSTQRSLTTGVPQGTVLSPLLFAAYLSDFPLLPTTTTLLYADDVVVYASSFAAQTAQYKLINHIPRLETYYTRWRLKINPTKSEVVVFTKKFTNIRLFTPLKIHNLEVPVKNTVKYLGVTLDKRFSFKQHVSKVIANTFSSLTKLYSLLHPSSPLSLANKLLLYKMVLRPALTYAAPAWNQVSNTQLQRIQVCQNKILRILTNSPWWTTNRTLYARAPLPLIKPYIRSLATKFLTTHLPKAPFTREILNLPDRYPRVIHKHKYIDSALDDV